MIFRNFILPTMDFARWILVKYFGYLMHFICTMYHAHILSAATLMVLCTLFLFLSLYLLVDGCV